MRKWRYISFAGVASVMLLATACSAQQTPPINPVVQPAPGANGSGTGIGFPATPSAAASNGTTGTGPGTGGLAAGGGGARAAGPLTVRSDAKLGSIVTDSAGMTLYRFDKDKATLGETSVCNGACAKTWPPVPAGGASVSGELNPDLLGEVTRHDGSKQLTLAGWPMYRYAKDTAAGQTNGQGVGGIWAASTTDGKKAGATRPAISVADNPKLGKILTDRNGKTLYLFTKDSPWPMTTACDAKCLQKWTPSEPITTADAEAAGLDYKLFLRFTTPNGTVQNSFNCWLLYSFKGDKEPGQTNGEGVNGTWFAVKADGVVDDRGKTVPAAKGESGGSGSSVSPQSSSGSSATSYGY